MIFLEILAMIGIVFLLYRWALALNGLNDPKPKPPQLTEREREIKERVDSIGWLGLRRTR